MKERERERERENEREREREKRESRPMEASNKIRGCQDART